jgi:hypothetical protein
MYGLQAKIASEPATGHLIQKPIFGCRLSYSQLHGGIGGWVEAHTGVERHPRCCGAWSNPLASAYLSPLPQRDDPVTIQPLLMLVHPAVAAPLAVDGGGRECGAASIPPQVPARVHPSHAQQPGGLSGGAHSQENTLLLGSCRSRGCKPCSDCR